MPGRMADHSAVALETFVLVGPSSWRLVSAGGEVHCTIPLKGGILEKGICSPRDLLWARPLVGIDSGWHSRLHRLPKDGEWWPWEV